MADLDLTPIKHDPRLLRLFACACARRLGAWLPRRAGEALVVAERYADGLADRRQLDRALEVVRSLHRSSWLSWRGRPAGEPAMWAAGAAEAVFLVNALTAAYEAAEGAARALGAGAGLAGLVREVFGNPFRPPPAGLDRDAGVRRLARAIDEEGRWADLPVLGDALEDAGCADESVLRHCREPGEHTRGCWVVDAILRPCP